MPSKLLPSILSITLITFLTLSLDPYLSYSGYTFTLDRLTRAHSNDAYISTYYFFWTNFTYLPAFFTVLFFIVIGSTRIYYKYPFALLLGLTYGLGYLNELIDYLALNAQELSLLYSTSGTNNLLTNTLNRYHPCIFYLSLLVLTLILFSYGSCYISSNTFIGISILSTIKLFLLTSTLVGFSALWLGSWWALQEGTWGGWWNWDASETFGLLVPTTALWILHSANRLTAKLNAHIKVQISLTLILLSYFFIQLNFDLTSHNFGARFFFFFNNNLFFLEGILLLLLTISFIFKNLLQQSTLQGLFISYKYINSLKVFKLVRLIPFFIITAWVLISYQPLLNYFTWNFIEINILNYTPSIHIINFFTLILFVLWLVPISSVSTFAIFWVLITFSNWSLALFIILKFRTRVSIIHNLLFGFTLLNWLVKDLLFTNWLPLVTGNYTFTSDKIFYYYLGPSILDTISIDITRIIISINGLTDLNWNFVGTANTYSINFFSLVATHSKAENYYLLGSSYSLIVLYFETLLTPLLNYIYLVLFLMILYWLKGYYTPIVL